MRREYACILIGIAMVINGSDSGLFRGLGLVVLGALVIRVYCEVLILFIKIHEAILGTNKHLMDLVDIVEEGPVEVSRTRDHGSA